MSKITNSQVKKLYDTGLTMREVGERLGLSTSAIKSRFRRNGFIARAKGCPPNRVTMTSELRELLDGLLLGDGCLTTSEGRTPHFIMCQVRRNVEWLNCIDAEFSQSGLTTRTYRYVNGSSKMQQLRTLSYTEFRHEYSRWYNKNGVKQIPKDLQLTPRVLALWYMGDGTVGVHSNSRQITFCTQCFTFDEVHQLVSDLQREYGWHFRVNKNRNMPILRLNHKAEQIEFQEVVRPFMVECFNYKLERLWPETN